MSDQQERCTRMLLDAIAAFRDEWKADSKYDDIIDQLDDVEEAIEKVDSSARDTKPDAADRESDSGDDTSLKSAGTTARQRLRERARASYKQDQASRGDKAA